MTNQYIGFNIKVCLLHRSHNELKSDNYLIAYLSKYNERFKVNFTDI